jgi:hypothetical protein
MSLLRRASDFCSTTLYERHGPIVEPNRLAQPESLAAGRLSKKITKILLRLVSFGDFGLQQIGQRPHYKLRQRAPVVTPTPDGHFANVEEPSRGSITAERYLEDLVVAPGGEATLEARWGYEIGTRVHGWGSKVVWLTFNAKKSADGISVYISKFNR